MPIELNQLLPFLAASVLITMVPGADMALITRQVFLGGPRLAQRTIMGNLTGIAVHGAALAVGLSALLVASATAYTVVKLAGAAYLIWLGLQTILAASRPRPAPDLADAAPGAAGPVSPRRAYVQGLVSTVLNPKPALFFLTFIPQFIDRDESVLAQTLFLTGIHIVVGLVWLTIYAHMVDRARRVLTRDRVRLWLERSTGAVLIALGVRVAVERR
jgi:threonine/homoserine/homoserine lactone efflux protein